MPKIKTKTVYLCSSCGDDHPKWNGQCPSCNEWGTLSEFKVSKDRKIINQKSEKPIDLKSAYNTPQLERFLTKINEIDRVLGVAFYRVLLFYLVATQALVNQP